MEDDVQPHARECCFAVSAKHPNDAHCHSYTDMHLKF